MTFDAKLVQMLLINAVRTIYGEVGTATQIDVLHCNTDTQEAIIRVAIKYAIMHLLHL